MAERGVAFTRENARRIAARIRAGEATPSDRTGHDLINRVQDLQMIRGKLDTALNSGSSATMSIWWGDPEADSGINVTVYDSFTLPFITSGKKIAAGVAISAFWINGKWHLGSPAACEVAQ